MVVSPCFRWCPHQPTSVPIVPPLSKDTWCWNSMNLPPDKMKLLNQYDNEKKWELICDQERFQVKNPPSAYIQKLKSYLDTGGVSRKFKRRVQESTQVLREWGCPHCHPEFLNEENKGLDVLLEYLAFAQCSVAYVPTGRKALRNSRLVSQKDDVHVCIMCLRAIMNYQSGFSLVMNHPACVNEITLSLNNKNARTKALVLELLAAVCLVRGGHDIILAAFDNFKEVCGEKNRFEKLMEYFRNEDTNIDFMVACMQFINIVVHSVENMNFRVFLQYEFTHLGLDHYLETLRLTESDKLQVQIQAYLDNVFDVGAMLEDSETKTAVLEHMEELQEHVSQLTEKLQDAENDSMAKIAELEKQLSQARRELEALRVTEPWRHGEGQHGICHASPVTPSLFPCSILILTSCPCLLLCLHPLVLSPPPYTLPVPLSCPCPCPLAPSSSLQLDLIPLLHLPSLTPLPLVLVLWPRPCPRCPTPPPRRALSPVSLQELDMSDFEEQFKTKAQGPGLDISALKVKATQKAPNKVTLMESNRAKNLAITLRKGGRSIQDICTAIETLDFLELLLRFLPTEYERTLIGKFEREQQPAEELSDEDQFMIRFSKIPRLAERMNVMIFLGNFNDTAQLLMPQLNAIIAASMSLKSSSKLRNILEIVLAFGNYMNSSKRGAAYGFRLQSLDALLEMKSTDRKQTLLHYLVRVITEKYPELTGFHTELHFLDKAGTVSLDSVLQDVRSLQQGMELTRKEFMRQDDSVVLKDFLKVNLEVMEKLQADSKTAKEAYESAVEYFGENPKTSPPTTFFPMFMRFIRAYKKAEQDIELWKKQEAAAKKLPIQKAKRQQMDMIAELKKKQMVKEPLIYEGKDGAIEDIISALKTVPFTARTGKRSSRLFCDVSFNEESPL
uniref:Formin like 1 n=1 Tax=Bubo bubo TaxID=30461 RepID=A0A8C0F7Y3_BUBBB